MTEFVQQLTALNLCAVNTLETWWKKLATQPPTRNTWRGTIFGHPKEAFIDLLLMDKNSSANIVKTYINSDVAFKSDHAACFSQVRLPARLQVRRRASRKAFIGWTPQDPQQHNAEIAAALEGKAKVSISDLTEVIFQAAVRQPATVASRKLVRGLTPTERRIMASAAGPSRDRLM